MTQGSVRLSAERDRDRPISAQRLPIALAVPRPRALPGAARPGAAFLTQLLTGRPNLSSSSGNEADCTYRRVESSDVKRLPPGYRKNLSA
ncbi:hypothetical protein [Pelagibacterium sediminicola]|uniref:hypothetical protein n=1 Tax=Pelagibacterium sediminicola TaxID=2248761 RepID=UPI000E323E82|nr:hypothetical protein [Pelagibacterium sediminicola]